MHKPQSKHGKSYVVLGHVTYSHPWPFRVWLFPGTYIYHVVPVIVCVIIKDIFIQTNISDIFQWLNVQERHCFLQWLVTFLFNLIILICQSFGFMIVSIMLLCLCPFTLVMTLFSGISTCMCQYWLSINE